MQLVYLYALSSVQIDLPENMAASIRNRIETRHSISYKSECAPSEDCSDCVDKQANLSLLAAQAIL